jgi:hypothetical protein
MHEKNHRRRGVGRRRHRVYVGLHTTRELRTTVKKPARATTTTINTVESREALGGAALKAGAHQDVARHRLLFNFPLAIDRSTLHDNHECAFSSEDAPDDLSLR